MAKKITSPLRFSLLIIASFSMSSFVCADSVYKWVDEQGNVHYSDIRPNDVESKRVKVQGGVGKSGSNLHDKAQSIDENKQADLERKAVELQEETRKRENDAQCQAIKDNLEKMRNSSRVKVSENGELRYLTPEEIAERKQNYEEMYEAHCSS